MRLLLDECLDWRLLRDFPEHEIKTTRQMGWSGLANGALLSLAEREFDAFVTADKNLSFQQNVTRFRIGVIVLRSASLRLRDLRILVPGIRAALQDLTPGVVRFVEE